MSDYFSALAPKLVYKDVVQPGDDDLMLTAVPYPATSAKQQDKWCVTSELNKASHCEQVGRSGKISKEAQDKIAANWDHQRRNRLCLHKFFLPLAELSRHTAEATEPGENAELTLKMWREQLGQPVEETELSPVEVLHLATSALHEKAVAISERACMMAHHSALRDAVLQKEKALLSQVHDKDLADEAFSTSKDQGGLKIVPVPDFDTTRLSQDAYTRRQFEEQLVKGNKFARLEGGGRGRGGIRYRGGKSSRGSFRGQGRGGGRGGRGGNYAPVSESLASEVVSAAGRGGRGADGGRGGRGGRHSSGPAHGGQGRGH